MQEKLKLLYFLFTMKVFLEIWNLLKLVSGFINLSPPIHNMPTQTIEPITLSGQSPQQLLQREDFRAKGYTLLEERTAYQTDPAFRQSVHDNFGKGIWTPELIHTDGAEQLPDGYLALRWFRRPTRAELVKQGLSSRYNAITGETKESQSEQKTWEIDGEEFKYECPPSGFQVPATSGRFEGMLYHPETGAAVATISDRSMAAERIAAYMKNHEANFKWEIPDGTVKLWGEDAFGKKFNPKNPTPEQLALVETSYQWSPTANSGVRAVRRGFWDHDGGPSGVVLGHVLSDRYGDIGARVRR